MWLLTYLCLFFHLIVWLLFVPLFCFFFPLLSWFHLNFIYLFIYSFIYWLVDWLIFYTCHVTELDSSQSLAYDRFSTPFYAKPSFVWSICLHAKFYNKHVWPNCATVFAFSPILFSISFWKSAHVFVKPPQSSIQGPFTLFIFWFLWVSLVSFQIVSFLSHFQLLNGLFCCI